MSSSRGCSCGWTPNTDDWHAELQFLWKPQSKTFSGIKKPCQEGRQQALSDHSPPSLWLVTPNGIYSHVLKLHSYPSIWPSFFTATYCQLQPTPIHSLCVSLLLLDKCQAQSIIQLSEFPGMGSLGIEHLRSHTSTCLVLILIKRRADVISAFLKLPLPFGSFLEYKAIWYSRLCFADSYFCILQKCGNTHNKHRLGLLVESLQLLWIDPFPLFWQCFKFALLKMIRIDSLHNMIY